MPSRYHPIEDGLWDDPKFDATNDLPEAPGEERGFFAFLSSNKMQRHAGIYRATDEELSAGSRIPMKRVQVYLTDLGHRGLIVRDGAWVFCPGYWKRQAHNPGMMSAARSIIQSCTSIKILKAFIERYPLHKEWLPNGWQTVGEPLGNLSHESESSSIPLTSPVPMQSSTNAVTEQSSTRAEQKIDPTLVAVLQECEHLSLVSTPASCAFWDQVLGACEPYPAADGAWLLTRLRNWNQWFEANKGRRSRERSNLEQRLFGWLSKDLEKLARRNYEEKPGKSRDVYGRVGSGQVARAIRTGIANAEVAGKLPGIEPSGG
jgi:hypothetical protein